jgi:hypothetical protein
MIVLAVLFATLPFHVSAITFVPHKFPDLKQNSLAETGLTQ